MISENRFYHRTLLAWLLACVGLAMLPSALSADISLPRFFSDHMVLQQKSQVNIWGKADPNQVVEIQFNKQTVSATADQEGNWSGTIATPEAGGPYQVQVQSKDGKTKVVLNDVMVGEVWICGGQNNMELKVADSLNAEAEIKRAKNFSNVRFFTVSRNTAPEPLTEIIKAEGWNVCNPDSVSEFSALAYFFGRNLNENLDVPVGLIHCSWTQTPCESWISRKTLESKPELEPLLKHWDENDDPTDSARPSNLFNGMIAPLKGTKFRGFIWYQGESNIGRARQLATLFPALIQNWRTYLENEEAPFLFVQLAPHRYDQRRPEDLPEIWDAQLKTLRAVPNTGMVVTTDIADTRDLHPKNKQEVARRLALWSFAGIYADLIKERELAPPAAYSGPLFKSWNKVEGTQQIRIEFDHIADGLECRGGGGLTHFSICGVDEKFVPANAVIEDGAVLVSSDDVADPQAVRFAWDDVAEPNLFNSSGLPASPFRTDEFKLHSQDVEF